MAATQGTLHAGINADFPMSNVLINRGQGVSFDGSNNLVPSPTTAVDCVGVAAETKDGTLFTAAGDENLNITIHGIAVVTYDGTVAAGDGLKISGATAGEFITSLVADDPAAVVARALEAGVDSDEKKVFFHG